MKRSGDSPLNCFHVIPAASVTSVKNSSEFTAAAAGRRQRTIARARLATGGRKKNQGPNLIKKVKQVFLMGGEPRLRQSHPRSALPFLSTCDAVASLLPLRLHARSGDKRGRGASGLWPRPDPASLRFATRSAL